MQVDRFFANENDLGAACWANKVVNEGFNHGIRRPFGHLQHNDIEVRRQKDD